MMNEHFLDLPALRLRAARNADLDYVLAAEDSADNKPFIIPWTREQHIRALGDSNCAHLIVEAESSVGYVILFGLLDPNKSIEFRRIVVTQKGHGYGTATVLRVQKVAFENYNAHRLWLDVKVQNERARSVYEKTGFTVEGTLRECLRSEDNYESLVVMSMLKREYQARQDAFVGCER